MDPQQRLILALGYEAFHAAGYQHRTLLKKQFGVFVGNDGIDWSQIGTTAAGLAASIISNRTSFVQGLQGLNVTTDKACSSSLVALKSGILNLRTGACIAAMIGGVKAHLMPSGFIGTCAAQMLSVGGQCFTFDVSAIDCACREGVSSVAVRKSSPKVAELVLLTGCAVN
jgi:acyl transferase domain-containing protein